MAQGDGIARFRLIEFQLFHDRGGNAYIFSFLGPFQSAIMKKEYIW